MKQLIVKLLVLLVGIAIGVVLALKDKPWLAHDDSPVDGTSDLVLPLVEEARAEPRITPSTQRGVVSYAPIIKEASKAVVNIYTRKLIRSPISNDPILNFFMGSRPREQNALGSGVIVGPKGLIVTNSHVVGDADEITVILSDRREFKGKIIYSDNKSDLALIKASTGGQLLPVMPMGDSDDIEVGDVTFAIGNPFGVGQTTTHGIISALRTGSSRKGYDYYIQTDASINPGNSGGALVSSQGKLIGINAFIYTRGGGSVGIGFAIPVNLVKAIIRGRTNGKLTRPWLGVQVEPIDQELARTLGMRAPKGVLVSRVIRGSAAALAGIAPGDVLLSLNGKPVNDPQTLTYRTATQQVGSKVAFGLLRRGEPIKVVATMKEPVEKPPRDIQTISGRTIFGGTMIANLSPAFSQEIGDNLPDHGVIVLGVKRGSPASGFRVLQAGDLLLQANDQKVTSSRMAAKLLGATKGKVHVTFIRKQRKVKCSVRLPANVYCRQ